MALQRFVSDPLPKVTTLGFFSTEYVFRHLFYQKIRAEISSRGGEYHFHSFSEMTSLDSLSQQIYQGGLFASTCYHCIFFDEQDLKSTKQNTKLQGLKKLQATQESPLVFAGSFSLTAAYRKYFPPKTLFVDSPQLTHPAEIKQVFELLKTLPGLEDMVFDQFALHLHALSGDVTRTVHDLMRMNMLAKAAPSSRSTREPNAKQNLFTFSKKMLHPTAPIKEIIKESDDLLKSSGDWYPFLGILHKLIHASPTLRHPQALATIARIDMYLKHFYPRCRLDQLFLFSLKMLRRSLQRVTIVM